MAHLRGTLDHFARARCSARAAHPAAGRTTSRSPSRPPRSTCSASSAAARPSATGPALPDLLAEGWIEWGGCGMVNPRVLRRLRGRPGALQRLRVRHGHRAHADVPPRRRGHARPGRGRRAVHRCLRHGGLRRAAARCPGCASTSAAGGRRPAARSRTRLVRARPRGRGASTRSAPTSPAARRRRGARDRGAHRATARPIRFCHGRRRRGHGPTRPRASSAAPRTSPSATGSSSRCRARCCRAASRSRRARRTAHVSDGMICSARELGHRRRPRRHPGAAGRTRAVGADARRAARLRDDVLDIAITPDRGYALSVRGVARELAPPSTSPFADPARRGRARRAGRGGWPVRIDDPVGCDRFVARVVTGLDPAAPSPFWLRRRLAAGRHAVDLARRRRHQLRDARARPAAARLRRGRGSPARSSCGGPRPGERLTTLDGAERALDADDLVIADDVRRRSRWPASWAAQSTEIGPGTTDVVLEAAHWDAAVDRPHRPPAPAAERGVPALRAGRRPGGRRRSPPSAPSSCWSSYGGGHRRRPAHRRRGRPPAPVADRAAGRPAGAARRHRRYAARRWSPPARAGRLRGRRRRRRARRSLPPTWRPDLTGPADLVEEVVRLEGYDTMPVGAAARAGRPRADRRRSGCAGAVAPGAGRGRATSRCCRYPFVGAERPRRARAGRRRPAPARRRGWPTRCRRASRCCAPRCCPGCSARCARNVCRGQPRRRAVRDRPGLPAAPATPPPMPSLGGRPPADRRGARRAGRRAARPAAARRGRARRRAEPAGWWGAGRAAALGRRRRGGPPVGRAAGVELARPGRRSRRRGTRAGAPSSLRRRPVVGYAGELHPRVVARARAAARAPARLSSTSTRCAAARAAGRARRSSTVSRRRCIDVALVVAAQCPRPRTSQAALRDGAASCSSRCGCSTSTPATQVGRAAGRWPTRCAFRAPDRTLTAEEAIDGPRRGGRRGGPADRSRPARLTRRSRRPAEVLQRLRAGTAGSGRARRRSPAPAAGRSGHAAAAPSRCPCGGRSRRRPHWPRSRPRAGPCRSPPWRRSGR